MSPKRFHQCCIVVICLGAMIVFGYLASCVVQIETGRIMVAPEVLSAHAVEIRPYEAEDGNTIYEISSKCWDLELDDTRLFHGDTIWWTKGLPGIKLLKYHPPPGTKPTVVTGDIP